ncbi:YqcC family protein [Gilvimarinus algae]|uniref:YqcC family protein n=1 Tax=Gilvimarinus algae TaxID=3058037 RepID=A0ABT8TIL0_9GAMM|nr:YqcC family protein [Gilvimarinus sp. SDUM040014]MDO3382918.1 YqcC family protein [Gilvimarinus sp. SDUM040014]
MSEKHIAVANILMDLEAAMRDLNLWHQEVPPPQALASDQPFAIDTLTFTQWLQFLFIPKMYQLVEQRAALPEACAIAPMAHEYFRPQVIVADTVVAELARLDRLLSTP